MTPPRVGLVSRDRRRGALAARLRRGPLAAALVVGALTLAACNTATHEPATAPTQSDTPSSASPRPTPTQVDESELWVDQRNPAADDANDGTAQSPLATIQQALDRAWVRSDAGMDTTIRVRPGTYREELELGESGDEPTDGQGAVTLTGEVADPARPDVVVTGADPVQATEQADGLWEVVWDGDFSLADLPTGWAEGLARNHLLDEPLLRRREMVVVDGVRLLPRSTRLEVADDPGTFALLGNDDRLVFHPPSDAGTGFTVEAARRGALLVIASRQDVTVRGMVFRHAATRLERKAVSVQDSVRVTFEDVHVVDNSWLGVGLTRVADAVFRRVVADRNGSGGLTAFQSDRLLVEDSQTNDNGWRASLSAPGRRGDAAIDPGLLDFASGQKFFRLRGATFRDHVAVGNASNGLWFDFDNTDVVVQGAVLTDNGTQGIFVEANQGPVTITDSTICRNEIGVLVSNSEDLAVTDSVIGDNVLAQVATIGRDVRTVNSRDGTDLELSSQRWTFTGNTVVALADQRGFASRLDDGPWDRVLDSLTSNGNRWWSEDARPMLEVGRNEAVSLGAWQERTGQDASSTAQPAEVGCPTR